MLHARNGFHELLQRIQDYGILRVEDPDGAIFWIDGVSNPAGGEIADQPAPIGPRPFGERIYKYLKALVRRVAEHQGRKLELIGEVQQRARLLDAQGINCSVRQPLGRGWCGLRRYTQGAEEE